MNRAEIINAILSRLPSETMYLEVGVHKCNNFRQIRAHRKIAVDPTIQMSWLERLRTFAHCSYYEMESDRFFDRYAGRYKGKLDVVFVDGLHTYKQSLQDILHAIAWIKDDGTILIHDCNPQSASAACSSLDTASRMPDFNGMWNGDVYKSIIQLRASRRDLEICVFDTDHGIGMVRKGRNASPLTLDAGQVDAIDYAQFSTRREEYLNLKSVDDLVRRLANPAFPRNVAT